MSTQPVPIMIKPYRAISGTSASRGNVDQSTPGVIRTTSAPVTTLIADAVIEEKHFDEMAITEEPVEAGSFISDHAYALPAKLALTYGWSAGSPQNTTNNYDFLKSLYDTFLGLQKGRILCTVNTGKRIYSNMLIRGLETSSDRETENSLIIRVELQEILLATTQVVPVSSAANQAIPQKTAPTLNQGNLSLTPGTNFNPGVAP